MKKLLAGTILAIAAHSASAAQTFADWTSFTISTPSGAPGAANGSAHGTFAFPSAITVDYVGGVYSGGGTTTTTGNNTNLYSSCATFTPCIALTDNISNDGGTGLLHTLTFSSAVLNPHLHIASMGRVNVPINWTFDADFTVLSGSITRTGFEVLHGAESFGSIEFSGLFTSISWVSSGFENTTGFTVSAEAPTAVPEPASLALLGLGLAAVAASRRKKSA